MPLAHICVSNLFCPQAQCRTAFPFFGLISGGVCDKDQEDARNEVSAQRQPESPVAGRWQVTGDR